MRLLPQSLFGRIVLILAGGFLVIQWVTTAIALSDRNALVFRAGANQAATRIGDVVRPLSAASPADRSHIMQAISNDTLKVTYGKPAGSDAKAGEESELMTTARDALALALQPGVGFKVIDAPPVYLHPDSGYARAFGELPGVRMSSTALLCDAAW